MKMKIQRIYLHFKIVAIAILTLGLIHTLATPLATTGFSGLGKDFFHTFLLMFISTGIAMVYAGLLFLNDIKKLKTVPNYKTILPLFTSILVSTIGLLACILGSENPFAWLTLAVGLYGVTVSSIHAVSNKRKFDQTSTFHSAKV